MRSVIHTNQAPEALGPYSQGISTGNLVFTAGQIPVDPATGNVVEGGFAKQVDQVLHNLSGVLSAAGSSLDNVVKFTVFVTDLGNFSILNEVFARHFTEAPPARSAVEVSALPLGVDVEIEAIGLVN